MVVDVAGALWRRVHKVQSVQERLLSPGPVGRLQRVIHVLDDLVKEGLTRLSRSLVDVILIMILTSKL